MIPSVGYVGRFADPDNVFCIQFEIMATDDDSRCEPVMSRVTKLPARLPEHHAVFLSKTPCAANDAPLAVQELRISLRWNWNRC
jgi:hypothetical protein